MGEVACISCKGLFEPYRLFKDRCAKCALDRASRERKEHPLPHKQWSLGEVVAKPGEDPFAVPEEALHRCAHEIDGVRCTSVLTGRFLYCWHHAEKHGYDKMTGRKRV